MAVADFNWQSTRNDIIERAFRICGALSLGEAMSSEQSDQGVQALNDMVKSWQSKHVYLWTEYSNTLTLSASTASYALDTDPYIIAIEKAFIRVSNVDTPIEVCSYHKYLDVSQKTTEATNPSLIATQWDRDTGLFTAYVWPVPNATGTIFYSGITRLKDWDTATSNGDFQPHWTDALTYGLAANLADEIGLPIREREYLTAKADDLLKEAKKGDKAIEENDCVEGAYSYRG